MSDQKLWTWHMTAGLVIFVLLGLHMVIMHLDQILRVFNPAGGKPVDWANVAERAKSVFFAVSYVVLLGAALFHGLYGLRNILCEAISSAGAQKAIGTVLLALGLGLFGLGTVAAIASLALAGKA